jgi:hypothetical protein
MMKTLLLSIPLLGAPLVIATPLARNASIPLSGVTVASNPELAGTVLNDKDIPFEIKDGTGTTIITGVYASRVVRSSTTGRLVFWGRIRNTVNPPSTVGWITHVRLHGFGFVDTDVETRTDAGGSVPATNCARDASGDRLTFTLGPGYLPPPDESKPCSVFTTARDYATDGTVTIFASNDPGGNSFSTTITGASVPVKPPLGLAIGKRFFFETLYYHPIVVTGAAEGVLLKVESSPDLSPGSWVPQAGAGTAANTGPTTVFGEVNPAYGGRQFYRVFCELPGAP